MQLSTKNLAALLSCFLQVNASASGSGNTTRYWDCCKPSCAWLGKTNLAPGATPVQMCDIKDEPILDPYATSGCTGGTAYQCSNESPWAVNHNLAYGYAAVNIEGGSEASWCCACYELTFTSGPVTGKKMVVQATNTGGDLSGNQFDLSIPGGGVGIFNGCTKEWGAPTAGWGAQYGGIASRSSCDSLPEALKDGCYWRYDWFMGADNPTIDFQQVACPAALTNNTHSSGNATIPLSTSPIVSSSSLPHELYVTTQESSNSSTPLAVTSTPAISPGTFAQLPSSNITPLSPSTTTSTYLEITTGAIEACAA